ncbi:MAG: hypothetical protein CL758_08320 [Chloroflexi bacterium]|nr:hypothetical protein [Chloroflexota bacterium]|tara:strand:- start:580 stop:1206 length:627 start_codon:yes stop_codon:yes gene_type:complete
MSIDVWFQLVIICLLGAMSPGPSLVLVVNNTFVGGKTYGIITSLAHGLGIGIWAFLTAIGVSGLLVKESNLLVSMQFIGLVLIAYIGFRTLFANNELLFSQSNTKAIASRTLLRGAMEGFLISILNPKIALFFLAIFSHLVQADSKWAEISLMGVAAAIIDASWYALVAIILTESNIGSILKKRSKVVSKIIGAFLVFISIYLFLEMI